SPRIRCPSASGPSWPFTDGHASTASPCATTSSRGGRRGEGRLLLKPGPYQNRLSYVRPIVRGWLTDVIRWLGRHASRNDSKIARLLKTFDTYRVADQLRL